MTYDEISAKVGVLRSNLDRLDRIPQASFEEFASDFRNVGSALHFLQTSIQALIDVGSWQLSRLALGTPGRSQAVFEKLEESGHLAPGMAARVAPIVGFRNRIVHLYDRIDERIVYDILRSHRRDLAEILDRLLAIGGSESY